MQESDRTPPRKRWLSKGPGETPRVVREVKGVGRFPDRLRKMDRERLERQKKREER